MSIFRKKEQWELVEEGKEMVRVNLILDIKQDIICDVYRRKKPDGIYEYKYVPRF